MDDYISIREFAERAGVSPQSVYKALTTKLSTYVQQVDNHRMLSIKALFEVYGVEVDNQVDNQNNQVDNQVATLEALVKTLQEQVDDLRKQVEVKDQQIESLHRMMEQQNALAMAEKGVVLHLTDGEASKKKWYQFWKRREKHDDA